MLDVGGLVKGCYTDHGFSGYGAVIHLRRLNYVDQRVVQQMAESLMTSVAAKCRELRARTIGHIKCHIRTAAGSVKADTLGGAHGAFSSGALSRPVRNLELAINSIVQGIPEEAVKAATLEGIHEIAENWGFDVFKEKEQMFFDEFELSDGSEDPTVFDTEYEDDE